VPVSHLYTLQARARRAEFPGRRLCVSAARVRHLHKMYVYMGELSGRQALLEGHGR